MVRNRRTRTPTLGFSARSRACPSPYLADPRRCDCQGPRLASQCDEGGHLMSRKKRARRTTQPQPRRPIVARPEPPQRRRTNAGPKRRAWLLAGKLIAASLAAFGAYTGWSSARPAITVELIPPVDATEEFDPTFMVRNTGPTAARDVKFNCADFGLYERETGAVWPPGWHRQDVLPAGVEYEDIGTLRPNRQMMRRCKIRDAPPGFTRIVGSKLIPILNYRSWISPWTSRRSFLFESRRGKCGRPEMGVFGRRDERWRGSVASPPRTWDLHD